MALLSIFGRRSSWVVQNRQNLLDNDISETAMPPAQRLP